MKRKGVKQFTVVTLCMCAMWAAAQESPALGEMPRCQAAADQWTEFRLSLIDWVNGGDVRSAEKKSKEGLALVGDLKTASAECGCARANELASKFRSDMIKLGASRSRVALSEAGWEATAAMEAVIEELQSCDEMKPN